MPNQFPVIGGISDTISPTTIMIIKSLPYKTMLVYILYSTVKYIIKTLLLIVISHVPKVPYAWYQAEICKAGSIL